MIITMEHTFRAINEFINFHGVSNSHPKQPLFDQAIFYDLTSNRVYSCA